MRADRSAEKWTDAYPIGNGTIGAMCFGGVEADRVQINDATCWSGSPTTASGTRRRNGPTHLAAAREALARGDLDAAEQATRNLQGGFAQAYQPLADLWIGLDGPALPGDGTSPASTPQVTRELDLRTAIATHEFSLGGLHSRAETFVSARKNLLISSRTYSEPSDLWIELTTPHPVVHREAGDRGLTLVARMPADVRPDRSGAPDAAAFGPDIISYDGPSVTAAGVLVVHTDGEASFDGERLRVAGATELRIGVSTKTDAPSTPRGRGLHGGWRKSISLARIATMFVEPVFYNSPRGAGNDVRTEHIADHARLFDRVELRLDSPGVKPGVDAGADTRTTEQRLRAVAEGADDPDLVALAFQYGRYLMIAGSRPGGQPLNLQGIWNESVTPPWGGGYTVNINTEMNYWPAHTANLSECAEPLLPWLGRVAVTGQRWAKRLYRAPGWVMHHNSDMWGFAGPVGAGVDSPSWSFWPMGGVWMARHLLADAEFTGDIRRLLRAWPIACGAAEFALAWLQPQPDGTLGTAPSTSPENLYLDADGVARAVSESTTSDIELVRDLFDGIVSVAPLLPYRGPADLALIDRVYDARDLLPPTRVTADGRIAEWTGDPVEQDPRHRHQSHLIGLYPGRSITAETPELFAAARRSLQERGPESTGWSLAWRLALWARLHDADGVAATVRRFLQPADDAAHGSGEAGQTGGVYPSLLCAHPPFQIDGNFGFTAGVTEALLQSHEQDALGIRLLRVLPAAPWASGSVTGLRARGAVTVDTAWADGVVTSVRLRADRAAALEVVGPGLEAQRVDLQAGDEVSLGDASAHS
nr:MULTISPECIES: glycoside hydrolase N-terminal domain-containing protein [Microbacterium]